MIPSAFEDATTLRTTENVRCFAVFRYLLPLANVSILLHYTSIGFAELGWEGNSYVVRGPKRERFRIFRHRLWLKQGRLAHLGASGPHKKKSPGTTGSISNCGRKPKSRPDIIATSEFLRNTRLRSGRAVS